MFTDDDDDDDLFSLAEGRLRHARDRDRKQRTRRPAARDRDAPDPAGETRPGLVLEPGRQRAQVRLDGEVRECRVPHDLVLAAGDEVLVAPGEVPVVRRALPRRTVLERRDPHARQQVRPIVANVDWIGIVGAASDPPLRPGLVDRYLAAVHRGGARPIVIVTKVDAAVDPPDLEEWRALGVDAFAVSAVTGAGLDALSAALRGRGALVGHSGVGKSSLLAALGADAVAGDLTAHGRGRHTTTGSVLHALPGGVEVIDTPGVREFAPPEVGEGELAAAFPDVAALAAGCAWGSCRHDGDDDCAVADAVAEGALPADRLRRYLRLRAG